MKHLDAVTLSIIGHAFVATTEEMGINLFRSAHSTIIREVRDIGTALFDADGHTVAMGNWIPMLLNAMEPATIALRERYDFRSLKEGEALLTNDPFAGGQHVNDILLFTPIIVNGEVIGLSGVDAHHLDLGGGAPASNSKATEVYQEGIVFPPMKVELGDDWEDSVFGKFFGANIRVPEVTLADFDAQIAACRTGETRVKELVEKYGLNAIKAFMVDTQNYSESIVRQSIEAIPDGDYYGESYMEDDGVDPDAGPHMIRVTIRVRGSDMTLDFTGTDPQARGFINIPRASVDATVRTTIVSIVGGGHVMVNGGAFRPIQLITPLGTLVNPTRPAPTRARTSTCYKIFDAVNAALAPVLPEQVIAPGFDAQTGISLAHREDGRIRVLSEAMGAGVGALFDHDGVDGMIMHLTNAMNTPVESIEIEFPFLEILEYGLRCDSGGRGRFRGGMGMQRRYRILADDVNFGLHSDRHHHSAPGLYGGGGGAPGACYVERDGQRIVLGSKVLATLHHGDILTVASGGGAGYGPPEERDPGLISRDIKEQRVTIQAARQEYAFDMPAQVTASGGKGD